MEVLGRSVPAAGARVPAPGWQRRPWRVTLQGLGIGLIIAAVDAAVFAAPRAVGVLPYPQGALLPITGLFVTAAALTGVYPGYGLHPVDVIERVCKVLLAVSLLEASWLAVAGGLALAHVALPGLTLVALLSTRELLRMQLERTPLWGVPVAVVGRSPVIPPERLRDTLRTLGFVPVADLEVPAPEPGGGPREVSTLVESIRAAGAWGAVIVDARLPAERFQAFLVELSRRLPYTLVVPRSLLRFGFTVSARTLGGYAALEIRNHLLNPTNLAVKRAFDLAVGTLLSLLTLPLVLLLAAAVKLVDRGPAFYLQEREGLGGRRIRVPKLRTMVTDAEAVLERYLAENPEAAEEWARYMKLRRDPRVLPVIGHLMRRFSLDELPQLWLVVKGEMSLVGPRPLPAYHLERFDESVRWLRRQVRPGITGLWQVAARSDGDLAVQQELDVEYVLGWSLWLDVYILLRTVGAVLTGRGAY